MDTSIPEVGDVVGFSWLYRRAVENIRAMHLPDDERQAMLMEIEQARSRPQSMPACGT